jgi:WD40 repeat protein
VSFLSEDALLWLDGSRRARGWQIPAVATRHADGHLATAWKVRLSSSGDELATVGNDETLRLWSSSACTPHAAWRGHQNRVLDVAWSPEDQRLATASTDGTVRIWDRQTGTATVLTGHTDEVYAVAFLAAGDELLSAGLDRTVWRWNCKAGTGEVLLREEFGITAMVTDHNGTVLALGGHDGKVAVHEGQQRRALNGTDSRVLCLALAPDTTRLAVGHNDGKVQIFDLHDAAATVARAKCSGYSWGLAFTSSGHELCGVDESGTLRVWTARGHELWACRLPGLGGPPMSIDIAHDGTAVRLATADGGVAQLDLAVREFHPGVAPSAELESLLQRWRQRFPDAETAAATALSDPDLLWPLRHELARRLRLEGDNPDIDVTDAVFMCAASEAPPATYALAQVKLARAGPRLPAWRAGDLPTRHALVTLRLGDPRAALAQLAAWQPPADPSDQADGRLLAAFVRARAAQQLGDREGAGPARAAFDALRETPRWRDEPLAAQFAAELERGGR